MHVQPGVTKLACPLVVGGTMRVRLERGQSAVVDHVTDGFVFDAPPPPYSLNIWPG
jgi:hypothetical protein